MGNIDIPFELRFFIALALAFLIGLERERSALITKGKVYAGVRTYSLIGVFGFCCAWLFTAGITLALPMGLLSVSALALIGYLAKLKQGHVGWTSEIAALVTFITGALCLLAEIWVPLASGIIATFLLSEKAQLEKYVERLDKTEFLAVVKFLLVTLIILPVLPNEEYTQFRLNPRNIWQIVVIVSSIGFGGYFLAKRFGGKIGLWLSGILGGIVSSTAATISLGRIAQKTPYHSHNALRASVLAGSVMYIRILVLIWIIKPEYAQFFWLKLIILSILGFGLALSIRAPEAVTDKPAINKLQNPFEIRPALVFALLFVILSAVTVLVRQFYGETGLVALAFITGVTDIDPFILSLVNQSLEFQKIILAAILVAMMSNTVMKGLYFSFLVRETRYAALWRYGIWTVLHIPVILLG